MATAGATTTGFKWEDYVPDMIPGPATTQTTTGATNGTGTTQEQGQTTDTRDYTGAFAGLAGAVGTGATTLLGTYLGANGTPQVPGEYQQAVNNVAGIATSGTAGAQGYADKLGALIQTSNAPWMASLGQVAEALAKEGLMAPIQTASPGPAAMRSAPPLGAGFMPAPAPMGGMPGAMPGMPTLGQQQPQPPAGGMPFQQMGGPSMGAGMPGSTGQAGAMGPKPGMPFAGAPGGPAAAPGGSMAGGAQPQQRPPFG